MTTTDMAPMIERHMTPRYLAGFVATWLILAACGDPDQTSPGDAVSGDAGRADGRDIGRSDVDQSDACQSDACQSDAGRRDTSAAFAPTRQVLGFDCQPSDAGQTSTSETIWAFDFSLSSDAHSFEMVPVVGRGRLRPLDLQTPRQTVDLQDDYRHHNSRLQALPELGDLSGIGTFGQIELDWPILVPYAPQYTGYVVPGGDYTLRVTTDQETPCLYVLEGRAGGGRLDINVFLVGAGGRSTADAADDPDLAEVFGQVDNIYEAADVHIGQVRYFGVPESIRQRYRVVRSEQQVLELSAWGRPPGAELDGHLSVDVFLVDDIQFRSYDIVGLSAGLPGSAGLHGNPRDGVVLQTPDLGRDNAYVGRLLAHEIGHYLGLRHTTETVVGTAAEQRIDQRIGATDPIADTPECDTIRAAMTECPDAQNLMFPAVLPNASGATPQLSAGQEAVFQANPLVKPAADH